MAYLTKLFQPQAQKSLASQIGQFFRGYPNLTILQVSAIKTAKGTSLQITATANGTRHFAAEFVATSLQSAAAQVQAFFVANPSVVPVKVVDVSPPKHSAARERLLVLYSQALAVVGGALPQGALSAGVVGDAQLLGAYGDPRGLVSLRNVGDAAWPAGGRGVAWRSALTGQWSGIGERTYTGADPAYTSTAPQGTTTQDPFCCGGGPLTYPTTVPASGVNTSSTTAFPVSAPSSTPAWSTCCTPGSGTTTRPGYTVPATAWVTAAPPVAVTCPTYTVAPSGYAPATVFKRSGCSDVIYNNSPLAVSISMTTQNCGGLTRTISWDHSRGLPMELGTSCTFYFDVRMVGSLTIPQAVLDQGGQWDAALYAAIGTLTDLGAAPNSGFNLCSGATRVTGNLNATCQVVGFDVSQNQANPDYSPCSTMADGHTAGVKTIDRTFRVSIPLPYYTGPYQCYHPTLFVWAQGRSPMYGVTGPLYVSGTVTATPLGYL